MTNAEHYKNEIENYYGDSFCKDFIKTKFLTERRCNEISCVQCHALFTWWLMQNYNPQSLPSIDWKQVPIDTLIEVTNNLEGAWYKQYFAGVNGNGEICAWSDGATSLTTKWYDTWKYGRIRR